ncbi:helix-turn-helix domain-containing protein [Saccharospirillum alexandrii]|uniref:helix-turn-helix domain-containing protein n=1 Tax=Saccharospirillum alexandrii TaxID=2448477 RepID=UPI000FDB8A0F|nr:helix-turn-helix domain-containing protein [Saccharospirillum alexandrii]
MTELSAPFAPDWVSPPGETILDIAEERGWTQKDLAQRLGFTDKHVSQLINGKVPLSIEAAQRLERVVGGTADFWLTREANYQSHRARLDAAEQNVQWVSWLDELPVKDLMASGAITKCRLVARNKPQVVEDCLRFFGVASPDEWESHYGGMQMSFRRSRADQSDIGAISAWLRLGEQYAEHAETPKYDKDRFVQALHEIRDLTCDDPDQFEPKMRTLLQEVGVVFVLVPAIRRTHVSGVARWLGPTRPLIQLSLYGKTNDKFWFTFFHEAAHILLHAGSRKEKSAVFLDDPNTHPSDDPKEHEANKWAGDWLIPRQHSTRLTELRSKSDVVEFARELGIHPGIVVGRLQHDGHIEHHWMNDLKQSFQFVE